MQNPLSLNDLYARYTDGLLERKRFEAVILETIREEIHRTGLPGWNRDDYGDFVSWLYPRISRAIDGYRETGSSFEIYIGTIVRLTAREYRSRQIRDYAEESAAWIAQIPHMYVCEDETEYDTPASGETAPPERLKNPRQVLILILKCCSYVSTDFLERVSPRLGIEPESLCKMIDYLNEQREKREMDLVMLREKANRQFYRCIYLERSLRTTVDNSMIAQRLRKQLERGRSRLTRTRKLIARKRIDPSNLQIARILGISKGTVDAVLYTLKTRWNNSQNETTLV